MAENMFRANKNMIAETIDALDIRPKSRVLEIGFGSGKHLPYLMEQAAGITYFGLDISALMVAQARINNAQMERDGIARFLRVSGEPALDFPDSYFAHAFAVNTIYFWQDPLSHLKEISRVLKPGGKLALAFVPEDFARALPFTQYGFSLYAPAEVEQLCLQAGFGSIAQLRYKEKTISNNDKEILRPFVIITGIKL